MLTAEEPSKLFSEACQKIITDLVKDFRQDDNDSPIYSSDRVMTDGYILHDGIFLMLTM